MAGPPNLGPRDARSMRTKIKDKYGPPKVAALFKASAKLDPGQVRDERVHSGGGRSGGRYDARGKRDSDIAND